MQGAASRSGRELPAWSLTALLLVLSSVETSGQEAIPRAVTGERSDSAIETVRLSEETWEIPTYPVGPPEVNPVFFDGRRYQGAKGPVYPYPLLDRLSTTKEPRSYKALVLENRYVSIAVLPELGGRIFAGQDKTNGYDFFYRQHVIKPALIGMAGAWISGGVEWNVFHHHRNTTFMPVDYTFEAHRDGSKTIWLGEIELRHRMKWLIGLTLRPDRSYLEQTVKLFNRTPLSHSFLYFANAAVPANERYQVLFPPRTRWATFHSKSEFIEWPVGQGTFRGVDYRGVDLSRWKNHPIPVSFFAVNEDDDFLAGYDHGKKAGLVHVADHQVLPGKKLWEWGNGSTGRIWDKILTDGDGPYLELMTGAYSDNQPDYSWLQPGEVKVFQQYWYPVRDIGGVKNANRDAAVHLEVASGKARLGFAVTAEHPGARALLWAGQRSLVSEPLPALGPGRPFAIEVALPKGAREEELRAVLVDEGGRELIVYTPEPREPAPRPKAYEPPRPPGDLATVEELYLAGSRLDQFYNPQAEPDPYYEEALRRDPGDIRANTALGLLYMKRGRTAEAERLFRAAGARATSNQTKARSAEPLYYLGSALQALGRLDEARAPLARAAWDRAWYAPSHLALAQIACAGGDFEAALESIDRSLSANALDTKALGLRAAILRHRGQWAPAEAAAAQALAVDPLDFLAGHERALALEGRGAAAAAKDAADALRLRMRDHVPSYLELAMDYANAGLFPEAEAVASLLVPTDEAVSTSPLLLYARADFRDRRGDAAGAARDRARAARQPAAYAFPWQNEMAGVLERAMSRDPQDPRAPYYLGNLIYDHQPDRAIALWEKARALDPRFATVHRNLAFGLARRPGALNAAVTSQEKAVALDGSDPTLLLELDELYEKARVAADQRLAAFDEHRDTVRKRDRTIAREARLLVEVGREDQALELLRLNHFHVWEGEAGVHGLYVEALVRRGRRALKAGQPAAARVDFQSALGHPDNIEEGHPGADDEPRVLYHLGLAQKALGRAKEARDSFARTAAAKGDGETSYYRALALGELGRRAEATRIFDSLVEEGQKRRDQAEGRYLTSLGLLGRGEKAEALETLRKTLELDPNHLGALGLFASAP
jgi:tetratricopeptide (TPR) repeat protein